MTLPNPNRRTVLKGIGAGLAGSAVLSGTASAGKPPLTPPLWTPTWGSDETDDWEITDVSGDVERETTKPYMLIPTTDIGKVSSLSSDSHFPGHYDQVVDTPPRNRGAYNVNWHTHNVLYDNDGSDHHNRPYNGKEVLANSYGVVKDAFDFFLGKHGPDAIRSAELVEVSPNDAGNRTGGDDYLNTIDQIEHAAHNGYANEIGEPMNVPDTDGNGKRLFPTEEEAFPDNDDIEATYGDFFGEGYFVNFTFVCPVRPTKSQDD